MNFIKPCPHCEFNGIPEKTLKHLGEQELLVWCPNDKCGAHEKRMTIEQWNERSWEIKPCSDDLFAAALVLLNGTKEDETGMKFVGQWLHETAGFQYGWEQTRDEWFDLKTERFKFKRTASDTQE